MNINKSELMTRAWKIRKAGNVSMSVAMKRAWAFMKKCALTITEKLNALAGFGGWSNWENGFLHSMSFIHNPETLSEKQKAVIDRMYNKVA